MLPATRQKRFTCWTSDGKRHWRPYLGITLGLSESEKFRSSDKLYDCRMHIGPRVAARTKAGAHRAKAQTRRNGFDRSRI